MKSFLKITCPPKIPFNCPGVPSGSPAPLLPAPALYLPPHTQQVSKQTQIGTKTVEDIQGNVFLKAAINCPYSFGVKVFKNFVLKGVAPLYLIF